ncbi:MAG: transposase [Halioglobus sp.]|jgi:transposase
MRQFIPTPSGRQRFNVLGALNAVTHKMITLTNTGYINSWSVVNLLRQLRCAHPLEPITVVLDNAPYQKCYLVNCAATMANIELLYLPTYSPNLNLIERAWKFVKKKALYCKVYPNFSAFSDGIMGCIEGFEDVYKEELRSLMTWDFQRFKKSQTMTA